jgi:hypothetical protein
VPHLALETCPAQSAQENVFCRVTPNHYEIHVFALSVVADIPMTGFASFPAEDLHSILNRRGEC